MVGKHAFRVDMVEFDYTQALLCNSRLFSLGKGIFLWKGTHCCVCHACQIEDAQFEVFVAVARTIRYRSCAIFSPFQSSLFPFFTLSFLCVNIVLTLCFPFSFRSPNQKSIEKLPLADQRAVNSVWSIFSSSSHARRALILQGILTMCCFSQLSFLSSELSVAIRIDPFSLFPREVSLRVLGFTDAITLGRAAQVSRSWKALADDDMLWRNMCEQHIERKCEKCGWGLPLLNDKKRRRKVPPPGFQVQALSQVDSNWKNPVSTVESNAEGTQVDATQPEARGSAAEHNATGGSLKRSITAAANAAALEKKSLTSTPASPNVSRPPTSASDDCGRAAKRARTGDATQGGDNLTRSSTAVVPVAAAAKQANGAVTMTMPWKSVYCERLMIERNWRGGRYNVRTLQGHTDGIMCLQFNESLTSPQFPILITGSYDRTARVWNLDTGKELRVLKGHTRGVRCLQFDEMKLITGSMDRTLKIWNWRTGELMRTLEGHTAGIVCLHFNDEILASGSQDSNINVWNFRSGECFTLKGHQDWINAVHLWSGVKPAPPPVDIQNGPDGSAPATTAPMTFLFSASDDCSIRLWDLQTRERLMTYEGHVGQVQSIKLVMLDDDAVRKLIRGSVGGPGAERADAERFGREETRRTDHGGPLDPDASRQQQRSTSAERRSYQQQREQREARSGTEHESVPPLDRSALWDYNPPNVPGGRLPGTNRPDLPDRFYTSAASTGASNFNRASTSSSTGYFRAEEELAQAEATMHAHNDHETIPPHLLHLQERLSAAGLVPPLPFDAELSDIDSGLFAPEDEAHQHQAPPSRPAPDAQRDRARNGIRSEGSGSSSKRSYSRSPNRQRPCARPRPVLISGSLDNTLKIWDIRTGRCIRTLFGHIEGVWGVDVDKLRIVSASHDKTIKIWDRDTALCQNTLVGHTAAVTCIGLGDDKIISGSDDSEIKVWSFSPDS